MIWIQSGRPVGRDLENWLQAEKELRKQHDRMAASRPQSPSDAGGAASVGEAGTSAGRGKSAHPFRRAATPVSKNGR